MNEKGCLFLCATPIGNMADITLRVLETLQDADLIACEDTRRTLKLLNHYEIKKPLMSYHEHNRREAGEKILTALREGAQVALVSDAGMPGISDPGADLVQSCIAEGLEFQVLPGASAVPTALILSGLSTERFCFEGFLPRGKSERNKRLAVLAEEERTIVLYEAPHRMEKLLQQLCELWGAERRIALCREITKKFEEVVRGSIAEVQAHFAERGYRGEMVLVAEGCTPVQVEGTLADGLLLYEELLAAGVERKEAMKRAAKETGVERRELYKAVADRR